MRTLLALFVLLFAAQNPGPSVTGALASGSSSCTPPSMTYRWVVDNASNTCNGGSACTNGAGIDTLVSTATANNATQGTAGNRPLFSTATTLNGHATAQFTASSSQTLGLASGIGVTAYTIYAVIEPTGTGNRAFVGGATGELEYRINSSNHQELLYAFHASIGTGTATFSGSSFVAIAETYDSTSGAYALYTCAGGTCTSDGTGTSAQPISPATSLGGNTDFFNGYIAEIGAANSILSVASIGTYVNCEYGL